MHGFVHGIKRIIFSFSLQTWFYFMFVCTSNAHNHCFILFYHVRGPAWIEIHWNSIWSRAPSHMTSHYTWGSMTTLHDFGGALAGPLNTFCWALTISWSQLLARVWSGVLNCVTGIFRDGPFKGGKGHFTHETESPWPLHFKYSHWWNRRSRSKFALHRAWGTNIICECKMDV